MSWYVARTKPSKEQHAVSVLAQRGIEAYLPILHKRKLRASRRNWEPLFACYVFANLEIPSDQWLAARSAPDVLYFLGDGTWPIALPDGFIDALTARVDVANGRDGPPRFKAGDRVVIADGPFQYMEAVFDRSLSPSGRSRVLVHLLNRLVPVQVLEARLLKVG